MLTHFLVVSDQDQSRELYRSVFGATVLLERDPVVLKLDALIRTDRGALRAVRKLAGLAPCPERSGMRSEG